MPKAGDDLVEVIEEEPTAKTPRASGMAESLPAKNEKFELRGFARTTLQLGLPPIGSAPRPPTVAPTVREINVGYERASSVNQAYLDMRYTKDKSFQAVVSGSLAYTLSLMQGRAGERPTEKEFDSILVEPMLREAYLGFYGKHVDLRLGQQRIVWGNSDGIAPNDVVNARDTRNRLQLDSEMLHIPTIAARADFDLGIAVLGLVFQPFFTPNRSAIYGTNWALVQADAPLHVRRFFGTYAADKDPSAVQSALVNGNVNGEPLSGASVGASLKFHTSDFDASFYYFNGRDPQPYIYLDPEVANGFNAVKSDQNPTGEDFEVVYGAQKKASAEYGGPFVALYVRRQHLGGDLTTTAGPIVLRLEGSFDSAMTFYSKQNLNSIARPTAQVVLGAEYARGLGKAVILEATYMRLLGPEVPLIPTPNQANNGPLLFVADDNVGVANVIRWTFFDKIVFEGRTLVGIKPLSWMIRPEIGYGTESFTARIGYLMIDGEGGSFGGYYRRNETAYVTTRYSF